MERTIWECIAYDLGDEQTNLEAYKKDLEKYVDYLESKNDSVLSPIISESDCPEIITPKEVTEERQRGITITKAQPERTAVCSCPDGMGSLILADNVEYCLSCDNPKQLQTER